MLFAIAIARSRKISVQNMKFAMIFFFQGTDTLSRKKKLSGNHHTALDPIPSLAVLHTDGLG